MKKKVLIISYSYPPSNAPAAQRPYALAKHFDKNKYEVSVLTCGNANSSLGFSNFDATLKDVSLLTVDALIGGKGLHTKSSNGDVSKEGIFSKIKQKLVSIATSLLMPDKGVFWLYPVKRYINKNKSYFSQVDVIISTSPLYSNHLAAQYVKKINRKVQWIADSRDFHYVKQYGVIKGLNSKIQKKLERNVIKNADRLIFVSQSMKAYYSNANGFASDKMHVIYNGIDASLKSPTIEKKLENRLLKIFYAGSFYNGVRSPHTLLRLIDIAIREKLVAKDDIQIEIAGRISAGMVSELKKYHCFTCVKFLGIISRNDVLKKSQTATLLWLIVGNSFSHYATIPLKFFEYMKAGKPILSFAPEKAEVNKIIADEGLGFSFSSSNTVPQNYLIFKEMITAFNTNEFENFNNKTIKKEFLRTHQAKLFENLFL